MSSTTLSVDLNKPSTSATASAWAGGKEPMNASYGKLMMWFFLLSDAFTFSALLITYGFIRYSHDAYEGAVSAFQFSQTHWPIPEKVFASLPFLHGVNAPLIFVGIMTFVLIMSSVTMVLAVEAGHRKDRAEVEKWMLWTLLGGAAFLGCQAWEWTHFITGSDNGVMMDSWKYIAETKQYGWVKETYRGASLVQNEYGPRAFADLFFFITGFHGFHVFSGVLLNALIFFNTAFGTYEKRGSYEMVEKVGLYWHFVDLVWVFVFTFFYLI